MARSTISMARSTPAQNPLGWAKTTRMNASLALAGPQPATHCTLYAQTAPPPGYLALEIRVTAM
jgi:hypothetical protein